MPNGHSQINNQLAQLLRQRESQLQQALDQIQQLKLGIQSISTLAAMYKAQLVLVTAAYKECLEEEYSSSDDQKQNISKAEKLIAAGHMEPVNEILKLSAQVEADKRLIEAQKNMIEQLEGELKQLKQ